MRYLSTRGDAARPAFCDILLGGLAPDGGLYLPESYPQIDAQTLDSWRSLSYHELAFEVLRRLIDDIPVDDLRTLCARTWRPEVYCHVREGSRAQDITPVTWLE
ncbi:MAG: threonine synthase, partial [Rhodocyclaceae bacterium]|nr:threonine synthase [Rhodocyclaceae bacterium]